MQLDLKKLPFGQSLSRHLLFEETDPLHKGWKTGLYLALATESSSMFGGVVARSAGFIRLTPTENGATLPYSVQATPAMATLNAGGGSLQMAIDGPALLLKGQGLGLNLLVSLGHGETVRQTDRGVELFMGDRRYIVALSKGSMTLDASWDLTGLRSSDPILDLTPEDGILEAVLWDTTRAYDLPVIAADVDAAAAKAQAAFDGFRAGCKGGDELAAYVLWLNFGSCRDQRLVISNKIGDNRVVAVEQAVAALAMHKTGDVIRLLNGLLRLSTPGGLVPAWAKDSAIVPEAAPPLYGVALWRAIEGCGLENVDQADLAECYQLLSAAVGWWLRERAVGNGTCFYAYPHECGFAGRPLLATGVPAIAPDLAAYLTMCCLSLSALAEKLGKAQEAKDYAAKAEGQLAVLVSLWDGENMRCRSALDGETVLCRTALGLVPLALGTRLPAALQAALRTQADSLCLCESDPLLAGFIALGAPALAEKLKAAGLENTGAASGAAYQPARCAMLLALNERS